MASERPGRLTLTATGRRAPEHVGVMHPHLRGHHMGLWGRCERTWTSAIIFTITSGSVLERGPTWTCHSSGFTVSLTP